MNQNRIICQTQKKKRIPQKDLWETAKNKESQAYRWGINGYGHESRIVGDFQRSGQNALSQITEVEARIQGQRLRRHQALVQRREAQRRRETQTSVLTSEQEATANIVQFIFIIKSISISMLCIHNYYIFKQVICIYQI